jgi:hypothetical protein
LALAQQVITPLPHLSLSKILIRPPGAITAAALVSEEYYDRVVVYERRQTAGGTWYFLFSLSQDQSVDTI